MMPRRRRSTHLLATDFCGNLTQMTLNLRIVNSEKTKMSKKKFKMKSMMKRMKRMKTRKMIVTKKAKWTSNNPIGSLNQFPSSEQLSNATNLASLS